jgi:hypothetical protein
MLFLVLKSFVLIFHLFLFDCKLLHSYNCRTYIYKIRTCSMSNHLDGSKLITAEIPPGFFLRVNMPHRHKRKHTHTRSIQRILERE